MTELVVEEPKETLLDLPKKAARSKPAKAAKPVMAIYRYHDGNTCSITELRCKRGDCRVCHFPDAMEEAQTQEVEDYAKDLERRLKAALAENEALAVRLRAYDSMKVIMAREYEAYVKQQPQEAVTNGTPS